ncbi:MAG TPA: CehA/McbA family metallohydrolase, partial [Polyangiaceae bacterium]|nr:CehA/McbA family metallohydrolase [Polyangiaceae bacterium]
KGRGAASGYKGTMPIDRGLVAFAALAILCSTCKPPSQEGGVNVIKGAGERFGMLCRFRRGGEQGDNELCDPGEEKVRPASVRRIAARNDRIGGPLAVGREGDYVLENAEVAFVINQLGRGFGFSESGGNIVDAADARARSDELGNLFTYFGVFPRQALYDGLTFGAEKDGTAWIEVRGRELYEENLVVTTRYTLGPLDRAVVLSTSLENRGDRPIGPIDLGDAVQWGAAEKLAPGKAPGFRGDYTGAYLGGVGRSVAYLLAPVKDVEVFAKNGTAWSNLSYERDIRIGPGEKVRYERVFAVAPRGDSVGVATEFFYMQGGAPAGLAVALVDAKGAKVAPPEGGRLMLERARAEGEPPTWADTWWWMKASAEAAAEGVIGGEVPPGRYVIQFQGGGRRSEAKAIVEVKPGVVTSASLKVSDVGKLRVAVREIDASNAAPSPQAKGRAIPAKIGIFDAATPAPASEPRAVKDGDLELPLAPGKYVVVASRGPEYSLAEASVEIRAGETSAEVLELRRVVDTRGYIGCDLHQHTSRSDDSGVAIADRVISNVVEGVECAVASEHNAVVDFMPIVRELGLARELIVLSGNEVSSDASRVPFGHVNVFPLTVDPMDPRGGATPVRDRPAKEVFDDLHALPGERVIQVNHPRSPLNGYFDLLKFDAATGLGTAPGYDPRFDAIEVWSGRYVSGRARVIEDLWALLRASRPVTPTGNTDTHGLTGYEAGYPRTFVRVPSDDPASLDIGALVDGLKKRRDVVITNGPFVTARVGSVSQGGLVSTREEGAQKLRDRADLVVRVERAPWVDASELVVYVGGEAGPPIPLAGSKKTDLGAIVDEISIPLFLGKGPAVQKPPKNSKDPAAIRVAADSFLVVVVRGARPLTPVLSGDPAEIAPFAMTSPLWIDADGDGRALGR